MRWTSVLLLLGLLSALNVVVVFAANEEGDDPSLRMEAVFKGLVRKEDGNEELSIEYSNRTRDNFAAILNNRQTKLLKRYCGALLAQFAVFAEEHGPAVGLSGNLTTYDIYDVGSAILSRYEDERNNIKAHSLAPVVLKCKTSVQERHGKKTPDRQWSLWIVACLINERRSESDRFSGSRLRQRWALSPEIEAALEDLDTVLRCPQEVTELALLQLEAEFRLDGVRKAHEAGFYSEDRLKQLLERNRVPNRARYLKTKASLLASRDAEEQRKVFEAVNRTETPKE